MVKKLSCNFRYRLCEILRGVVVVLGLGGTFLFFLNADNQVMAAGGLTLGVSSSTVTVGSIGSTSLVINSPGYPVGDGISAFQVFLSYDPTIIQIDVNNITLGTQFSSDWIQVVRQVNNGLIRLAYYTTQGSGLVRTSGNITLVTITFSAINTGTSPLVFVTDPTFGPTWISSLGSTQNQIAMATNGSVQVIPIAPTNTPVPTSTPTPTATSTPSPTSTPMPTNTPVPTSTPTPTATNTPSPTSTPMPTNTPRPTNTPVPTSTPLPTVTPIPGGLTLTATSAQTTVGNSVQISLNLNSPGYNAGEGVSGFQIFLNYDSSIVSTDVASVSLGSAVNGWSQAIKEVTNNQVRLAYYTLSDFIPTTGQIVLANINFNALSEGVSPLAFVSDVNMGPTIVTLIQGSGNLLEATYSGNIIVNPVGVPTSTPIPTNTPSPTATLPPMPTGPGGLNCGDVCNIYFDRCPAECPCRPTQDTDDDDDNGDTVFKCGGVFITVTPPVSTPTVAPQPTRPPIGGQWVNWERQVQRLKQVFQKICDRNSGFARRFSRFCSWAEGDEENPSSKDRGLKVGRDKDKDKK